MPPRRSARAKATVTVAEDTVAVDTSPKVQEPQTPKKGTKRAHSDNESEMPPAKKIKTPADGTPRRPDGTAMKVPVDHMSGFYNGAYSRLPSFFQSDHLLSWSPSLRRWQRRGLRRLVYVSCILFRDLSGHS